MKKILLGFILISSMTMASSKITNEVIYEGSKDDNVTNSEQFLETSLKYKYENLFTIQGMYVEVGTSITQNIMSHNNHSDNNLNVMGKVGYGIDDIFGVNSLDVDVYIKADRDLIDGNDMILDNISSRHTRTLKASVKTTYSF